MFGFQPVPIETDPSGYDPPEFASCQVALFASTSSAAGTSHTINLPAFNHVGSKCVLVLAIEDTPGLPASVTGLSGWTFIRAIQLTTNISGDPGVLAVYIIDSITLGSTINIGTAYSTTVLGYAAEVTCLRLGGGESSGSSSDTASPPAPSPSETDSVLQMCAIGYMAGGNSISSFASGYTIDGYYYADNGNIGFAIGFKSRVGTETPGNITLGSSCSNWGVAVEVFGS